MKEYIEREAAASLIDKMSDGMTYLDITAKSVINGIKSIPAADVRENVEAHWIEDRMEIVCSKCNARFSDEIIFMDRNMENEPLKYCPNCGADMREES